MEEEDGYFKEEICTLTPGELFDAFLQTTDLQETLDVFRKLCQSVDVNPRNHKTLYASLKSKLTSWKCKSLWTKLDKRAEHKDYRNKPCVKNKVLIIGAGPCGLRSAIEAALLGAYVVVIEKRDRFSRNNVLHLWPFLIVDLKNLGAKKFFGQFCAGAIDHISIRRLQVILLKVSLLLGVQVYAKCGFLNLVEPTDAHGWRGNFDSPSHHLNKFDFDIVVAADGRRAALKGFKGKEFRGKLAIGITVNFVNKNSKEEARVEEISGVAFIFNQQFFQDLKDSTGIDLENIVYYKDETHYFVMCAKKNSLLQKGVLKKDFQDAYDLLQTSNVNHDKLLAYAREAANFSTSYQLPQLDFAKNHYFKEDVAMFDFTSLYHSEHAAKIYERRGKRLLALVVGDSLLEPFWPTGSGCARGFLGCFDAAWTMRGWGQGREPIDLLTERDSIFRLLAQTTPENISKNFDEYSINPATRYPNLNKSCVSQNRVKHLFDNKKGPIDQMDGSEAEPMDTNKDLGAIEGGVNARMLLRWCQEQTKKYRNVKINDMSKSWRNGLAFCAIIHRYRPDLIDYSSLSPKDHLKNTQLAFDVAEEHLGIPPQISASEMAMKEVPDTLMIVSYVSQYHEVFKNETPAEKTTEQWEFRAKSPLSKLSVLTRVSRRTHKEKRRNEEIFDTVSKRRKAASKENEAPTPMDTSTPQESLQAPAVTTGKTSNRISALAAQVFGPTDGKKNKVPSLRDSSEHCFFCNRRVYLMERLSAEGHFFHRECFLCEECGCTLRLGTYSYISPSSDQDKGHFLCHLHYDQLLYKMQEEPADEQEVTAKGKPKLLKSKSAAPETLFKNVEFTIDPDAGEPVSYKTKGETGAQMNGYHEEKETVSEEKEDRPRDRSYTSGKYRRLEARPLRRSSISSVRKSDATVREKGKGYSFDDGLDQTGDGRRRGTQPLKIPSREEVRKFEAEAEFRPGTPGELIDATKGMTVVDINMEEAPVEERKKKREEERKGVIDAVKTAAAGKSWVKRQEAQEGKVQKLGTLERRKAKSRRAMYPPLSMVFNPDEKETQEALEGIVQAANETERNPQKKMQLKMVDISLDDDTPIPSSERKAAGQTKAGPKTVSVATKNEPTPSPRSPTSPTSPGNKKPPAGSLVAARTARLTNLIANDFRPPTVKDKWAEREEWKKSSPVKNDAGKKFGKEEELEPTASPGAQRRSLPRVPSEEPFHSTKETTKIVQRKPTGKPRFRLGKVRKEIGEEKEEKIGKDSVDMGFVVLDLHDGISTPEKEEALNLKKDDSGLFSESSGDEMLDDSPKLQRTNARRFSKPGRRDTEMPDDKVKRREQAKIRSAMKQRESKRLRMAQSIQRELEEVAVKQADLEREGVVVEKTLRQGNNSGSEEQQLMFQWFKLVNRKNALIRYESELVIQANSIQLEDQQGRLEQEIRELLMKDDPRKDDNRSIQKKTKQLVDIVEQRNALVELLDEERKREQEEDRLFDAMIEAKGFITTV